MNAQYLFSILGSCRHQLRPTAALWVVLLAVCCVTVVNGTAAAQTAPAPPVHRLPPQREATIRVAALARQAEDEVRKQQRYDYRETFDQREVDTLPPGWKVAQTGPGATARWGVVQEKDNARRPVRALAVLDTKNKGNTFNLAVAPVPAVKDLLLQVDLKKLDGEEDPGGGLIWRMQDDRNYYLARWNTKEQNVRLYKVEAGVRTLITGVKVDTGLQGVTAGPGDPSQWHELSVKHVGQLIRVEMGGTRLFAVRDATFTQAGGAGLYTKSDARSAFRDFRFIAMVEEGLVLQDALNMATLGRRTGGQFVEGGGWTPSRDGDRIVWDLPPMSPNGMLEFDVRNFNPVRQCDVSDDIFFGMWGSLFDNRERTDDPFDRADCDNYEIRMGTAWRNGFKTENHANGAGKALRNWEPFKEFDPCRTYHFKVEWREGKVTTWINEQKLEFDGVMPVFPEGHSEERVVDNFNFMHVGASGYFGTPATIGPVYSNFRLTALKATADER